MKRELLSTVGMTAIVVVGMVGCSSKDESSSDAGTSTKTSAAATTTSATATTSASPAAEEGAAPAAPGSAQVTVDGQVQPTSGPVVCETSDGKYSIAIGDPIVGVIVGLEPDGSVVHGVGLGTVNGVVLSFTEGVPGNEATATKDGNNYSIKGTASGADATNQQVSKPFQINVTCP